MGKFVRAQIRLLTDHIRRIKKLQEKDGVDRSSHIRIAIARYLDEEEMRKSVIKARIEREHLVEHAED